MSTEVNYSLRQEMIWPRKSLRDVIESELLAESLNNEQINVKTKKQIRIPVSEWINVYKTHWFMVQKSSPVCKIAHFINLAAYKYAQLVNWTE
jgi:hypothetical protein